MSRLIDADELLKGYQDHEMISTHIIWNAPTVEAIPIEWLLKWAEDRYFLMATSDDYHLSKTYYSPMFKDAIKDWREEQEARA